MSGHIDARLVAQLNQLARLHTALREARAALVAADAMSESLAATIDEALNFGEGDAGEKLTKHINDEVERRIARRGRE